MQVDWRKLANELGAVNIYSSHLGLAAIEEILGEDFFRQAVEYCLRLEEGWCLSEGVLRILRPLGMKHCYDIYKNSNDPEERQAAVWLLKYTSDREVLEYIPEFLADPDENIQGTIFQILDQMLFWRAIHYEDIIPILESAANHPNQEIRKLATRFVNEETIQGMNDFTEKVTGVLICELSNWKKRLKFETIHGLDLRCVPWFGQLELSFLTDKEDFDLPDAYSEEYYSKWRLDNLPYFSSEIEEATQWMQEEVEKSVASLKCTELFLSACVSALKSSKVQKILRKYNLAQNFQITVFNHNSSFPRKNYYLTS